MNLFNQLANLNRPAVNDPKLSDFTSKELNAVYVAVNMYLSAFEATDLREDLELFLVQIHNAHAIAKNRERTLNT